MIKKIIGSLLHGLCGNEGPNLDSIHFDDVTDRTYNYILSLYWAHAFGLFFFILLIEFAVPPLALKFRPFTQLSNKAQWEYLETWQSSRWYIKRTIFNSVKATLVMHLFSSPQFLQRLGYQGRTLCKH